MAGQALERVQIDPQQWTLAGSHPQNYESRTMANARAGSASSVYLQAKHKTSRRVMAGTREDWAAMRLTERIQAALLLLYYSFSRGFGTLIHSLPADSYKGKRLRLTGYVKAEGVEQWAGLWMRIDGPHHRTLKFDNMQNRPLSGTFDWQQFAVVLDVPPESEFIVFGLLLDGRKGRVWLDDVCLDVVGDTVPPTA